MLNPVLCKQCSNIIPYKHRNINKFCSTSCAGTYNNNKKDWSNIKTGPKPKPRMPKLSMPKTNSQSIIDGPFTRIYLCKCKITGKRWYAATKKTIHPSCIENKKLYSYQARFTFSINKYPLWFADASLLINQYGWYSAANRGNNLSGCSRDHLYSVADGFKNKIDPNLLSHPANCKIVPHRQNQNKHKNSSITLDELKDRINKFEQQYGKIPTGVKPV